MASYSLKEGMKAHLRDNAKRYYLVLFCVLIAAGIGIFLSISGFSYSSLLPAADKNMLKYISGTASYGSIFASRIWALALSLAIIFVFNIIYQTSFLSYLYLAYQMCLIILSSAAIITLYGFSGVMNVIFFTLPINLGNFILLTVFAVFSIERAAASRDYRTGFLSSAGETNYFRKSAVVIVLIFGFCLIYSFILPLIFKSFVVINY